MSTDPNRVKEVFLEAAEQPDDAARTAYLDRACAEDAGLRERVEALLRNHDPAGSFLGTPAGVVPDRHRGDTVALDPEHVARSTSDGEGKPSPTRDEDADDLSFLAPSTRQDSLGRLGHYEILQVLGKGGFGIVFRAFDDVLQRVVAIKVMAPHAAALSPARKRFLRETRSSAQVRHENVVQIYEVGEQPLPFFAMEFIPGETLQQKLDRCGPLEVLEILRIGRQIAEGLAAAHACDLIHRDIKPGNILLEGGQHKAKITDFGLARTAADASISQSGLIAGTPMFMSPEQALGQKVDQRADLFSLGSVLYQMTTGRPPFRAPTTLAVLKRVAEEAPRPIPEIIPETPDWLCGIVTKLHAKNPEERFQSAREVADLLADCEAKLKAKEEVKNVLPAAAKRDEKRGATGARKWVAAAAAVLLLPVFALALTEFAGVTQWFRVPPPIDKNPITPGRDPLPPLADGWVQLFNGEDLTGWDTLLPDTSKVENGAIVGKGVAYLYTSKTYRNFHCRIEAKMNAQGAGGISFRTTALGGSRVVLGKNPAGGQTGSITRLDGGKLDAGTFWKENLIKPDIWFTVDLVVRGSTVVVRVDDVETAQTTLERLSPFGAIGLHSYHAESVIHFKKIEIKELPPSAEELPPTPIPATYTGVPPKAIREKGSCIPFSYSPDGKWLLTRGHSNGRMGALHVWEVASGELRATLDAVNPHNRGGVFSPDSTLMAHTEREGKKAYMVVLNTGTFDVVKRWACDNQDVGGFSFDRTSTVLGASIGKSVILWNAREGTEIARLNGFNVPSDVAFSPTSDVLAVQATRAHQNRNKRWEQDSQIAIFDMDPKSPKYKTPLHTWEAPDDGYSSRILFSPDGARVLFCRGERGLVRLAIHDVKTGECVHELVPQQTRGQVTCGSISPDGTRLVLRHGKDDEHVSVWNVGDGTRASEFDLTRVPHRNYAVDPTFRTLCVGFHATSEAKFYDLATGKELVPSIDLPKTKTPLTFKNSIGMEFVIVPKGKSWLGGGKDKLGDKEVDIPADFYLGKYEVTQEEWEKVMGENPSHFSRTGGGMDTVKEISDAELKRFPVEFVSRDRCQLFLAKLNELEREKGWVYRLPTRVEWEYACRGGPMAADAADRVFDFYLAGPTNELLPTQANFGRDTGL